jgi:hypothetical protein
MVRRQEGGVRLIRKHSIAIVLGVGSFLYGLSNSPVVVSGGGAVNSNLPFWPKPHIVYSLFWAEVWHSVQIALFFSLLGVAMSYAWRHYDWRQRRPM